LGGLQDITTSKIEFGASSHDGIGVGLTVAIANPSNVWISLGNATFAVLYKGVKVANVRTDELLTLHPGNNDVGMTGKLNSSELKNKEVRNEVFTKLLTGEPLDCTIMGLNTRVDERDVRWLSKLVDRVRISTVLHPKKTDLVKEAKLSETSITINTRGVTMSARMSSKIQR
jgi:hypothetical protein